MCISDQLMPEADQRGRTSEAAVSPIVTVTVRSKAGSPASSELQHVNKRSRSRRNKEPPRRSGGWSWKGDSFLAKVHLNVSAGIRKITHL